VKISRTFAVLAKGWELVGQLRRKEYLVGLIADAAFFANITESPFNTK